MPDAKKTKNPDRIMGLLLPIIVLMGFAIRAGFIGMDSLWPDEGLYMHMSRNIMLNPFALEDTVGNFFYKNPPLFMYILSLFFKIMGGAQTEWARLINTIFAVATIFIVYMIGKHLFGELVGLISAILLALNPLHWWMSTRILTDIPLTFFVYLSIYMLLLEKKTLFYLFAIGSLTMKYPGALVFLVPLFSENRLRKHTGVWAAFYGISLAAMISFVLIDFKVEQSWINYFLGFLKSPSFRDIYVDSLFFISFVVCIFFFIGVGTTLKKKQFNPLLIWVIIFGTVRLFLTWDAFRVTRYALPLYPGLIIFAALGGVQCYHFLKDKFPKRVHVLAVVSFAILSYVLSIYSFRGYTVTDLNSRTFMGFESVKHYFKDKPTGLSILTSSPRQIKFMVPDCKVYDLPKRVSTTYTRKFIRKRGIDYVLIDRWSPHQPRWVYRYFTPEYGFFPVFWTKNLCIFEVKFQENDSAKL